MPSLHFNYTDRSRMEPKCMFCRGKNILCSADLNSYHNKDEKGKLTAYSFAGTSDSILLHVFQFLDLHSLLIARKVCNSWKRIAEDRQLWKTTNFSCKRIVQKSWIFSLPKSVRDHANVMNLMWSSISISAFRSILKAFPKTEVLLLQNCRFSNENENSNRKRTYRQGFPTRLKILDVRNVQDRWFDEYTFPAKFQCIQAVAFSQTLPNNWLSILSTSWMPNLKILHIQNNPCVTEPFLQGIIENAPCLASINVQGCMNVSGNFISIAVDQAPFLRHIDANSTRLEGKSLTKIDWSKCKLESLSISFCCKITSNDLKTIMPRLVYLKHFQASFVGWGKSFNDDVVNHIVNSESNFVIEFLDIQSTFNMSAGSLIRLSRKCPKLKSLRIGTILKTRENITNFLLSIPQVTELSLQAGDCNFTAFDLLNLISDKCKELKSFFLYNIQFDLTQRSKLEEALETMLRALPKLDNFFIGGYPHKERAEIEEVISSIASSLHLRINTKRPRRVIPMHAGCFDSFLTRTVSIPAYKAFGLRSALQRTHDCQTFYQTGIQKMNHFVRNAE